MSDSDRLKVQLATLLEEKDKRIRYTQKDQYFPDDGPYAREKYPQHVRFMNAGAKYSERAFIAGNRLGKSVAGGFEMTCHLIGEYPHWWKGKRFDSPVSAWAAGITNESTRNIIQEILFGKIGELGTGLLPKDSIIKTSNRPGVPNAIGYAQIKHVTGGYSEIELKSYVQGWETFQGTKKQLIWLDEEPSDPKIYSECLMRTAGDSGDEGIMYCTFTPLLGLSTVVLSFLPGGKIPEDGINPENPSKFTVKASWDDVPHLSEEWKKKAEAGLSPHEKAARMKGLPSMGAGAIYPIDESVLMAPRMEIPVWWPRAYGMDVGWNRTAAIFAAMDPSDKTIYLYSEHYVGQEKPPVHASAIKSRGDWQWGAIDPGSRSSSQADGTALLDMYLEEGLQLVIADNAVEAGIYKVWNALSQGRLKIMEGCCPNLLEELRLYRRDDNGKIIKKNDHLMDALRYLMSTGLGVMTTLPDPDDDYNEYRPSGSGSNITGY